MQEEIVVLSAGAVQPGLVKVIDAFRHETGDGKSYICTAPTIRKRLSSGAMADVLIAPPELLDEAAKTASNRTADRNVVGLSESASPFATTHRCRSSLLSTSSNNLSSAPSRSFTTRLPPGSISKACSNAWGISAQLKAKTTRSADFAAVRDHVTKGTVNEIGLGATTVIIESASRGLKFAGPLPAEIQNYTTCVATVRADSPVRNAAVALLQYLSSFRAKTIFTAAGIE
jgi:molybdate transport system substrate-binding protein